MDTKDLLNDSSIHHGRNLVCLMNRKGFKVEDLEKALQLSQKQVEELTEMKKRSRRMNKSIVLYLLLAGLLTCFSCTHTKQQPEEEGVDSEWLDSLQHVYQYGICIDSLDVTEYKMRNGDNPAAIFSALGFSALKADSITKASIHVLNPTKLRAGMNYYTFTTQESVADIRYIAFAKSLVDYAVIDLTGDSILAYEFNKPITIKRHYTEGTINSSLWNVIKASGADPLLAIKISDVYAWQIDFSM